MALFTNECVLIRLASRELVLYLLTIFMVDMSGIRFELRSVAEKPKKPGRTRKGSKYEPIIEEFLSGSHGLVRVDAEDVEVNYLRSQLAKIIKSRDLEGAVEASVVDGRLYLEKTGQGNDTS